MSDQQRTLFGEPACQPLRAMFENLDRNRQSLLFPRGDDDLSGQSLLFEPIEECGEVEGMRAISVKPEWAWLIAHGHKSIENRTWSTHHRGPLAIHAGKRSDPAARELCERLGIDLPDDAPSGRFVCVVDLVDIVPVADVADDPFAVGPFCWKLANPRVIVDSEPINGQLGLYNVPAHLTAAVALAAGIVAE